MRVGYVDTSYVAAIALGEARSEELADRLNRFDRVVSAGLLEAEFRSLCCREKVPVDELLLLQLEFVAVERPLSNELADIFAMGYVRGADAWHLAHALYFADGDPGSLGFLTLDARQREVAERLGFAV